MRGVAVDGATTAEALETPLGSATDAEVVLIGVGVVRADRTLLSTEVFGPDGFHPGRPSQERLAGYVLERLVSG